MAEVGGSARSIGRLGGLSLVVGLISFFGGLFFFPRTFMFVGIALLITAVALFWLEETGYRKRQRTSWR